MLALVVLFTLFVGLVGLLAAIGECQKRRRSSAQKKRERAARETLARVKGWLTEHGLDIPSGQQIVALLNSSLQQAPSKEWRELKLESLSGDSGSLPSLNITTISAEDKDKIQFECKLEGLPSVGVSCVNEAGERISCSVEVEWLFAMTQLTLRMDDGARLLVSVHHTEPIKMSLACAAQGDIEDGERLSSSVADDLQVWFSSLSIDDVTMPTPIPSLLVSDHDHHNEEGVGLTTPIPTETPPPLADGVIVDQSSEPSLPNSAAISDNKTGVALEWTPDDENKGQICEGHTYSEEPGLLKNGYYKGKQEGEGEGEREGERATNEDSESIGRGNSASGQPEEEANSKVLEEGVSPSTLPSVREEEEGERGNSRCADDDVATALPTSPSWRRSPSYEQLQQIELDPYRLVKSSGVGTRGSLRASPPYSSDRRALTLSVSGSEAESIYGADERIPSTLVFQVEDSPNKLRHIVAVTPVHAVKLRRRYPHAKKLHIYNDHCFTAMHIKKRTECVVCGSKISGLFGKQAYICQDCSIVVHKQCHFKVDGQCSGTQLHNMNLIYPDNTSTSSAN